MRIVHYFLGLYPKRTGGLNRYATDLIREQAKEHQVSMLIPGRWQPFSKKCYISKRRNQDGQTCYHLNNASPQPLLFGVKNPRDMMGSPIDRKSFERFYDEVKPDVIHLHTLMGLSVEILSFFKEKSVKIVFTSHDYFGICPKVNLINWKGQLCEGPASEKCEQCNAGAPSTLYLRLRSSNIAFYVRDLIRWLKITI